MDLSKQIRIIKLLFCLISFQSLSAQSIDFFREYIEIDIEPPMCSVTGYYYFKNPGSVPLEKTIYFPFIISDSLAYPRNIHITNMNDSTDMAFARVDSAVIFRLYAQPQSISRIKVVFSQITKGQQFEYILKTTQKWGKPLERASYRILHPHGIELRISYPKIFKKSVLNGKISHYIQHKNFMPCSNLIISWKNKK